MTPEAQTQLRELLAAYDRALGCARTIPTFAWLRRRRGGRLWHRLKLPTLRWGLMYFLVNHMRRTTDRIRARYQSLAANEAQPQQYETGIQRIELFQASLPNAPYKRLFVILVAVAGLLALPLARFLFQQTEADDAMLNVAKAAADTNPVTLAGELLSLDGLWAVAILALTLYCVALLPLTAYRWQRIVFTLDRERIEPRADLCLADFARPAGGVYQVEQRVFRGLGVPPMREIPWEVWGYIASVVALLPFWLLLKPTEEVELLGPVNVHRAAAVTLAAIAVVAAWFIYQGYRRRNGEQPRLVVAKTAHARATPRRTPFPIGHVACLWERAAASAIDSAIIVSFALAAGVYAGDRTTVIDTELFFLLALPVVAAVYTAVTMLRSGVHHGQTLGKQAVGIRVVTADGGPAGLGTVLLRESVLKWIVVAGIASVYSLWTTLVITVVWAFLNASNRAPHDLASRTIVVRAPEPSPARIALALRSIGARS